VVGCTAGYMVGCLLPYQDSCTVWLTVHWAVLMDGCMISCLGCMDGQMVGCMVMDCTVGCSVGCIVGCHGWLHS
jgi:hypothetical protein